MNSDQLDAMLRRFSTSEKGYRNGTKKTVWEQFPHVSGRPYCIDFHYTGNVFARSANDGFHCDIKELGLSINKNSRFSPVPMHTHNYTEISYMYDGSCLERIGSNEISFEKGQVLIIDTNAPHAVGELKDNDIMINLLISREYLHDHLLHHLSHDSILSDFFVNVFRNNTAKNSYLHVHSENSRRIPLFFNELLCECCDPSVNSTDIITSLMTLIFAELINVYEKSQANKELGANSASFIPIIHYLEANFKTCTRKSVADIFQIHEKYLTTLIKKNTGMTYKQLVQQQKLKYAAKLLKHSSLSISEVITESGYENATFFYGKFYEEYHMSPKDYRNSH